ncbi:MAG: VCBS repeat-containing protein, partial [Planctomycetes bacterium]|nr:VCBS repeat-containing protein [Planctomycetota bacterium]
MIGKRFILEIMGPGSALFDYDNDGDLDLFLVQGRSLESSALTVVQSDSIHRLFRNDLTVDSTGKRQLRFTDVTQEAGLTFSDYGMGVIAGDVDRDGHVDLYVTCYGRDRLLRNTGRKTFEDVTESSGLKSDSAWSTSASFADYDRDGWLDLFVCQYLDWTFETHIDCKSPWGGHGYCGPKSFTPSRSRLYHNLGNGRFEDVSQSSGINSRSGPALGVVGTDLNDDGWVDFFVANDAMPNNAWINQRNGTFVDEALVRGCAVNADGKSEGNMGIIAADFFNRGRLDLFITHIKTEHATFYENLGEGMFSDITASLGLDAPTRAYTGFGTGAIDFNNDGKLDIFVTNGGIQIDQEQERAGLAVPLRQKSLL